MRGGGRGVSGDGSLLETNERARLRQASRGCVKALGRARPASGALRVVSAARLAMEGLGRARAADAESLASLGLANPLIFAQFLASTKPSCPGFRLCAGVCGRSRLASVLQTLAANRRKRQPSNGLLPSPREVLDTPARIWEAVRGLEHSWLRQAKETRSPLAQGSGAALVFICYRTSSWRGGGTGR